MVSLISLAALIGPQALKPAVNSPRTIETTDLPELANLYLQAYGDGTSGPNSVGRISAVFEGAHGTPIPKLPY